VRQIVYQMIEDVNYITD